MKYRTVARLDIKNNNLIKGVHLEGLRVVGDPVEKALLYYKDGIDELLLIDSVASLYQRNNLSSVISKVCQNIFIPVTVGGGIRSISDAQTLFHSGADKVAINTAAHENPALLSELCSTFGSQAVTLSVQAKRDPFRPSDWLAMSDNGRESTGKTVQQWIQEAAQYGFGEILLTSIDQEGTCSGFDLELVRSVSELCDKPILISGGLSTFDHAVSAFRSGAHACVIAHALHYNLITIPSLKDHLTNTTIPVRSTT